MTRPGSEFADDDVVAAYVHRPPYPPALFARLADLAPRRGMAIDLGCGPGKLALGLAPRFDAVVAIDPSAAMVRAARDLTPSAVRNIRWIEAYAEDADLPAADLAVAGASIHWMDPTRVFPRLAKALGADGVLGLVGGDEPAEAPWLADWRRVIRDWVGRLGGVWNGPEHRSRAEAHRPWFDLAAEEVFPHTVTLPVDALVEGEHSRATWARFRMGEQARDFDADLHAVLAPHAQAGAVTFEIHTRLAWGRPRRTPRQET